MDKEVFERFKAQEKALELQAKEYERRLEGLNHEAQKLATMQISYIPRETFDRVVDGLRDKIAILEIHKTKQEGRAVWREYIPWIIATVSVLYQIFKPK